MNERANDNEIVCGSGQVDKAAVSVWDEEQKRNVCALCGSADLVPGYGLAGGGGIGGYNWCNGCEMVLDKSEDNT